MVVARGALDARRAGTHSPRAVCAATCMKRRTKIVNLVRQLKRIKTERGGACLGLGVIEVHLVAAMHEPLLDAGLGRESAVAQRAVVNGHLAPPQAREAVEPGSLHTTPDLLTRLCVST